MKTQIIPVLKSLKFAIGFECNLHCGFCLQQSHNRNQILDFKLVQKIFQEEMVNQDVELITLTGGEPTINRYLKLSLQIVRLASQLKKESCIFTNGVLLNEAMLDIFKKAGLTRFRISLYDPINWSEVSNLMKNLKTHGFPALAKYTVTKETFPELDKILANIPQHGIEWFQIKPYNRTEIKKIDTRYEMTSQQVLNMARKLLDFRKQNPQIKTDFLPLCYEFLINEQIQIADLSLCHCGKGSRAYLVIGPTGDVKICGAYPEPIGNIKYDTITNLWRNHPLLMQVRNLANRTKPKECATCQYWEKCVATDCHSATFAKFRNFNHGNPQCPILTVLKTH